MSSSIKPYKSVKIISFVSLFKDSILEFNKEINSLLLDKFELS
jgi:hypothetical protein